MVPPAGLPLEPPPIVSREKSNTGNSSGASRNARQSVGGGYAAQSQHRNSARRRASEAETLETLGSLGKPNRVLSKDRGKKYQVYLLSAGHLDILEAVAGHADDRV